MIEAVVRYLRMSGLSPQSVDRATPDLPRWERYLRSLGICEIPPVLTRAQTPAQAYADRQLNRLMLQAVDPGSELAHWLRDLDRVRPVRSTSARRRRHR